MGGQIGRFQFPPQISTRENEHRCRFSFPPTTGPPRVHGKLYGGNGKGGDQCNHTSSNTLERRRDAMGRCNFSKHGYCQPRTHCHRLDLKATDASKVMLYKHQGYLPKPPDFRGQSHALSCHIREWNNLHTSADGNLWQTTKNRQQLVLPQKFKELVYRELHNELGHLGVD